MLSDRICIQVQDVATAAVLKVGPQLKSIGAVSSPQPMYKGSYATLLYLYTNVKLVNERLLMLHFHQWEKA